MSLPRLEADSQPNLEERALRAVDEYIEQVEKKAENPFQPNISGGQTPTQVSSTAQAVPSDMGVLVSQSLGSKGPGKIVLPLDEGEVKEGLHRKVLDSFRWVAEWCNYMIKKYPGRVFYPVKASGS